MNKKSIAWKFFDISTTPHMSKCKLCDSLVTRGGKSLKSYGTTAMVKHLRLKHSKEFELAGKKRFNHFRLFLKPQLLLPPIQYKVILFML